MALFPDNPEHSSQILNHQNYIHHNMECVDQDPIEVILVFDEDGHGQHYKPCRGSFFHVSGDNRQCPIKYDPYSSYGTS